MISRIETRLSQVDLRLRIVNFDGSKLIGQLFLAFYKATLFLSCALGLTVSH